MFKPIIVSCIHKFISFSCELSPLDFLFIHLHSGRCLFIASCLGSINQPVYFWNKKVCITNKGAVSQALAPTPAHCLSKAAVTHAIQRAGMHLKGFRIKGVHVRTAVIIDESKGTCLQALKFQVKYNQHNTSCKICTSEGSWQKALGSSSLQPRLKFHLERMWGRRPRGGASRA